MQILYGHISGVLNSPEKALLMNNLQMFGLK